MSFAKKRFFAGLLSTAAFFFSGLIYFEYQLQKAIMPPQKTAVFELSRGESQRTTLCKLQALGLVQHCSWIYYYLRLSSQLPVFQSGYYRIGNGHSIKHLMQDFKTANTMPVRFTILPGSSWSEVEATLAKLPYVRHGVLDVKALAKPYDSMEGLLMANTYQTQAGRSALDFLKLARRALDVHLQAIWQERDADLPYKNPYELLILASIVEREAQYADEKTIMASVMVNRIQKNMPLQMDSTIQYAKTQRFDNIVSHKDLKLGSVYNTYLNRGLPPTPIAMVSEHTLVAMAHPAKTRYLYFVAKGDGRHQFSETYREQVNAIKRIKRGKI